MFAACVKILHEYYEQGARMNVQKLVWEEHVPTAQSTGEFRPGEVRSHFSVPFPVGGTLASALRTAPITGILMASGTAWIPAKDNMMNVGVDVRVAGAGPGTPPVYSEHFQRFANGDGSTHHAFPLKARSISLPVGSYVITIKSLDVETWLDGNDRWEISLAW